MRETRDKRINALGKCRGGEGAGFAGRSSPRRLPGPFGFSPMTAEAPSHDGTAALGRMLVRSNTARACKGCHRCRILAMLWTCWTFPKVPKIGPAMTA